MITCRLCGKQGHELEGVVLQRVNEKGVEGIWECRPICGAQMADADALEAAIEGTFDKPRAVQTGFEQLQQALADDGDYAQGWHDNLACSAMDEGVDSQTANRIASRFMKLCFDVQTVQR